MEKGRKSSQPPCKEIQMCDRTKLNDHWYGLATVPTDRTRCRRHHLIKRSNFCEGNKKVFAQKLPHSRHEQRRRDPEKKATSLIFTAILLLKDPSTPSSITVFIIFERDWFILVRLEIANSIHIWDRWDWIDLGIIVACYGNITMNSLIMIIMCYSPLMSE